MFRLLFVGSILLTCCLFPQLAAAVDQDEPSASRQLQAQYTSVSITVDGRLEEEVWASASRATGFTQYEPREGTAPTFPTNVRVLYGENGVYVGAELHDSTPDKIVRTLSRRDVLNNTDRFVVSIDSYFNHELAYTFAVSAAGVQADWITQNERRRRVDTSWDAIWYSNVRVTPQGWTVEMQIPYSMLRFSEEENLTWGINFRREIARLSEVNEWAYVPRTESNYVANFGKLQGITNIAPQRTVQVTPYSLSRLSRRPNNQQQAVTSHGFDAGADLKVGLGSNITLDATINPDFGQVESDPAILNLTTFETFFPEKRPFFLEGAQIFDFKFAYHDGSLLYTRRIGAHAAPVIGALKLTGRTTSGYSFGLLGATTGKKFRPGRYYSAARLRREFGRTSYVGAMVTGYGQDARTGRQRAAATGGVDWDLRFGNRGTYQLTGYGLLSHQTAENKTFNPGFGFNTKLARVQGNFTYLTSVRGYNARFNSNQAGRLRENDFLRADVGFNRFLNNNQPFGPFQRARMGGYLWKTWLYSTGLNRGWGSVIFTNWELNNLHSLGTFFDMQQVGGFDVHETRGLGPYKNPGQFGFSLEYGSDSRKRYHLTPQLEYAFRGNGGRLWTGALKGRWDVSSRTSLSGEVAYKKSSNVEAWMANEPFLHANNTWKIGPSNAVPANLTPADFTFFADSQRLNSIRSTLSPVAPNLYNLPIFGRRDTRSLSINLRGNIIFLPNLSLQLYNQLFVARGQYDSFGVLTAPDKIYSLPNYSKQHDFSIQSYISNIVLRWEYRPGSTLFFVWSQTRQGNENSPLLDARQSSSYDTPAGQQLINTFDLFPTNVLLVKFSYAFLR